MNIFTQILTTHQLPVFQALALEKYMLEYLPEDQAVLLFWKTGPAVVIGKNQNPFRECHIPFLMKHRIPVTRRISGGGTVYHDPGNLNYAFFLPKSIYREKDIHRVVMEGLRSLGIEARLKKKNAIFTGDYKISGTAFRYKKNAVLHHGTLLLNADLTLLEQALKPTLICSTRAVSSNPSPVMNLKTLYPNLSESHLIDAITQQWNHYLKGENRQYFIPEQIFSTTAFQSMRTEMESEQWIFGETPDFSFHLTMSSGEVAQVDVEKGKIAAIRIPEGGLQVQMNEQFESMKTKLFTPAILDELQRRLELAIQMV